MLGPHFYNEAIRKTVIAFGTLFNNIELRKKNPEDNTVIESSKVPLAYGPKQKFLTRLEENPTTRKVAITLPRLYFELVDVSYDANRKTSSIRKTRASKAEDDATEVRVQYVPVPYDLTFELGIIAKSSDDGLQILEQILPYFQPAFNVSVNFIPDMDEKRDIAVQLNNVNYEDDWDDSFLDRRSIVWTLSFTVKSYIYGPYSNNGIIRKATIYESVGDLAQSRRTAAYSYSPKALEDKNNDGVITAADDELVISTDDFGFNEGIEIL